MDLWRVPLQASTAALVRAQSLLDATEIARADRLRGPLLRGRFVLAHAALRRILGAALRQPPQRLPFTHGARGKPALAGLHFNLSHADDLALIVVSHEVPVGVDLEAARPAAAVDLRTVLSPLERATLHRLADGERAAATLRCWVRKEALLKAAGLGIADGLDRFSVTCSGPARLIESRLPPLAVSDWSLARVPLPPPWTGAVAVHGTMPTMTVRHWSWDA